MQIFPAWCLVLYLSMSRVKSRESSHVRQKYAIWKKKRLFFLLSRYTSCKCGWIQRCAIIVFTSSILDRVQDFRPPHLVGISFNFGSVTDSNICSWLIYQLVAICSLLTVFDGLMSTHQYLQGCGLPMPNRYDTVSHPVRPPTADRHVMMCLCFGAVWRLSMIVLPTRGLFMLTVRSHFARYESDKDIGIVAYYLDVRVIICSWRNYNQ